MGVLVGIQMGDDNPATLEASNLSAGFNFYIHFPDAPKEKVADEFAKRRSKLSIHPRKRPDLLRLSR